LENKHEDFRGSRWVEQLDGDLLTGCSLIYMRLKILEIMGLQVIVIRGQIRARAESGTEVFQNVSIDEILS